MKCKRSKCSFSLSTGKSDPFQLHTWTRISSEDKFCYFNFSKKLPLWRSPVYCRPLHVLANFPTSPYYKACCVKISHNTGFLLVKWLRVTELRLKFWRTFCWRIGHWLNQHLSTVPMKRNLNEDGNSFSGHLCFFYCSRQSFSLYGCIAKLSSMPWV